MIRAIWCVRCGAEHVVDTAVDWWSRLRCQFCGGGVFSTFADGVPGRGRSALALTFDRLERGDSPAPASARSLYCGACGQARTVDPTRLALAGLDGAPLTCFRCGGVEFTTRVEDAPRLAAGWLLTRHDRELLAQLGIARGPVAEEAAR